jgi:phage RecT family recombinase
MPPLTLERIETQLVTTQPQWMKTLPAVLPPDKFVAMALLHVRHNPKLLECSEFSLLAGLYRAAHDGLELNGEDAYLIPYGKEATYIKGYKGIIKQLMRAGASDAFAEVVYSRDHCVIDYGNRAQPLVHQIALSARGEPLGAYGAIQIPGRNLLVHYMDKADIDDVRAGPIQKQPGEQRRQPGVSDYRRRLLLVWHLESERRRTSERPAAETPTSAQCRARLAGTDAAAGGSRRGHHLCRSRSQWDQ